MDKLRQAAWTAIHKINRSTGFDEESDVLLMEATACLRKALAEQADGEQWSPDDMAYRPSGLSMEQAEQELVGIVWDASAPVVMDSSAPKNENQEVAELRKQVAALKSVLDAWNNVEQEPVAIGSEWKPCMKLPVVVHVREQREGESHVSTREGITPVRPDDLIMRGVAGEEYPIGRELFNRTYTFDTAAPVRTKDLTDDEIGSIYEKHHALGGCWTDGFAYERAVIEKFKEKNK